MPAIDRQNRTDCIPELACTRCRERKIRCGRERPQCSNCEREDGVPCLYQSPAKRVNHLKLLCDSIDQIQDRLYTIESRLDRLVEMRSRSMSRDDISSVRHSQPSLSIPGEDSEPSDSRPDTSQDDDDESMSSRSSLSRRADSIKMQIFRNQSEMVDRYHGPSSLFTLCNQFRLRLLATPGAHDASGLPEISQNLCEMAGVTEPFPAHSDQPPSHPLSKHQATTAVSQFLQNVDCVTDIFVPDNLRANLGRIDSQPAKPGDDAWAICFRVITLLVLGMEISSQVSTALAGDFARSLLPSRAALVTSRLLTTPRLINIQTLILLSVAAQQFDPPGWAELIMAHACMLARTMGLQHADMLPPDGSSHEAVERAKVLKALYIRDKSLCTTRGSVSWLPVCDSNITCRMRAAVEQHVPYADRLQLAIVQDEIYRVTHGGPSRPRRPSRSHEIQSSLQSVEHQLQKSGITTTQLPQSARRSQVQLEFLATRILAVRKDACDAQQVITDARTSCVLVLLAHGTQTDEILNAFSILTGQPHTTPSSTPPAMDHTIPFGTILDAFSVPAFFILLEGLLQPLGETRTGSLSDHELLRRLSECYTDRTQQMLSTSYHHKVSQIFNQALTIVDTLQTPATIPCPQNSPLDSIPSTISHDLPYWHTPSTTASSPVSWDHWLSLPMSLDTTSSPDPPPLTQLSPAHTLKAPDPMPLPWEMAPSTSDDVESRRPRKRSRTQTNTQPDSDSSSPLTLLAIPFPLIS
ncbi:hypothetical protein BDV28DRAFT_148082 [Aspergillus coremiiformis]|uniref:Zn(2)-C6 fungal-type domain-containing protein n=1 Tax=Aspergillus coremiiformis TaxID=138285 RepID=A0A5N6Z8B7_9EURO|nr:hypothetical protein BDV28DRAFT_148082 [Aspergillus coremiiformis]